MPMTLYGQVEVQVGELPGYLRHFGSLTSAALQGDMPYLRLLKEGFPAEGNLILEERRGEII